MAKYIIPESIQEGLKEIASLSNKRLSKIVDALLNAQIGAGPEKVSSSLLDEKEFKDASILLKRVLRTIYSLISLRTTEQEGGFEESLNEFVNNVVNSYNDITKGSIKEKDTKKLITNLTALLNRDGVVTQTVKALKLYNENNRNFVESRIISDIRIVFDEDFSKEEQGAIVVHELRIDFFKNGERDEIYIAMGKEDLDQLKDTIDRALEKDRIINSGNIKQLNYIDPKRFK